MNYPLVRLRYLAEFNPPIPADVRADSTGDYPLYSMDTISEFSVLGTPEIRPQSTLATGYSYLEPQDVGYAKVTPCFENGKGLLGASLSGPTFATTELTVLRPGPHVDQRFIGYLVQSSLFREPAIASMTGAGGLKRVSEPTMKDVLVPAPARWEQSRIADFLDHETAEIDAFIAEQAQLIHLTAEKRAATIDEVLLLAATERIALKHLGFLSTGLTLGATYSEQTETYPYIRVANVQANRLDLSTVTTVDLPASVAARVQLLPGDVLMTEGGDRDKLGRGALWSGEVPGALHQNHVFAFRCSPRLLPEFLVYALEATEARSYFEATASQSTNLASTNSTLVKRFKVPRLAPGAQRQLVATLDRELNIVSEAAHDAKLLITLAQERRSALISAAVTGQIDVAERRKPAVEQLQDEIEETR